MRQRQGVGLEVDQKENCEQARQSGQALVEIFEKVGEKHAQNKKNAQERKSPKRRKNRRGGRKRETREIGNFGKMCALRAKIN